MKKLIYYQLMRSGKISPQLVKRLKLFALIGFVGLFVSAGLTIWAGVATFGYVSNKVTQVIQSPETSSRVAEIRSDIRVSKFEALGCWSKAQSLMAIEPWLERSALVNLTNLKMACLDEVPPACEGHECNQRKQLMKTAEGRTV